MAGKGSAPGERRGGRTAGTPNKLTQAARERIEADGDPIGFLLDIMNGDPIKASPVKDGADPIKIVPTLDQRQAAANTLARKLVPDAKDARLTIDLPEINNAGDAVKAISAIAMAVASGDITPSEGQAVAGIVETYRRMLEMEDLERRIAALEAQ